MTRVEDSRTDEQLLESTPRAPEAFGVFYQRHEDAVLSYFLRRIRDPELAADLTAETFAAALLSVRRFRGGGPPAGAWLFGIARHQLGSARRRARVEDRARRKLGMPPLHLDDDVIGRVEDLQDGTKARDLLEALPSAQRAAVEGRVLDERSYLDLAEQWQCSPSVVRQRVSRGLSTLRTSMEDLP
jgi:RNA polymerase sigma factor (sigma-70 family)